MSNPIEVLEALGDSAEELDQLGKDINQLTNEFLQAEAAWEQIYDQIADSLKEEMVEQGRKGDPAEHTILREARKADRLAWRRYRDAKKWLDANERQIRAAANAMSGRQSELNALKDEARAAGYTPTGPVQTFGRKAA